MLLPANVKKQIIISPILEFGGINSHLKLLIRYFGEENLFLILENKNDFDNILKVDPYRKIKVKVFKFLRGYVRFRRKSILSDLKDFILLLFTLIRIYFISIQNGFAQITISCKDPEKFLYFLWLPFIKVNYILHSEPFKTNNFFTTFTCNNMLGKTKRIITVSYSNKKTIVSNWKIANRKTRYINVVYNCLDKNEISNEHFVFDKAKYKLIVTSGHVVDYKNPDVWLQVAKQIVKNRKDVIFYWLGNGELLTSFQQQTKCCDKIKFIGVVNNPGIYLNQAMVYYQPSLMETQGIGVIEAMAHCLPCVVSNVGGLPESIESNKNGFLVSAYNVREHINRLSELLDNKDLCKSFGECSYKKYQKLFSYNNFQKNMDAVYLA